MSHIIGRLVQLLEKRRLHFERTYAHMTLHPLSGKPGFVPPDPYPKGAVEEEFLAFRARTGIDLPDDVKHWLRITNAPSGFFGIGSAQKGSNMEELWQLVPQLRREGWIPVGRDTSGNFYVRVVLEAGKRGGVFYVHGTNTDELACVVASSTLHFALFCLEELEAGRSGQAYGWPQDKAFVLSKDPELVHVEGARFFWDP